VEATVMRPSLRMGALPSSQCQGDSAALRWLDPDHLVSGS
jgi:hypothetical protein